MDFIIFNKIWIQLFYRYFPLVDRQYLYVNINLILLYFYNKKLCNNLIVFSLDILFVYKNY